MFTGIVQGLAQVVALQDHPGLRRLRLRFPAGFDEGLAIGASVAVNGVCLTVTDRPAPDEAGFDAMQQTLALTTLGTLAAGDDVHVERAAREGAEVGGHVLSGHVDCQATLVQVRRPENNVVLRFAVPAPWRRYLFAKGYLAVHGTSLTLAEVGTGPEPGSGWFEVWLIPETLRLTTFGRMAEGARVNIEIERQTQVIVDTVRATVQEQLAPLVAALRASPAGGGPLPALQQALDTFGR